MRISVVVPVYNEEDGIAYLKENLASFERLLASGTETQYVLVDDGSSDSTLTVLREVFGKRPDTIIVPHGINRGVGAATRTGFQHATGEIVCTIDADCTYRPEKLVDLIAALDRDNADIAVASPYHPQGGVVGVPRWRLFLSKGCSFLYRRISPLKLYTYTSVFRAYRLPVVKAVEFHGDGFVSASEILINAAKLGFKTTEVPMVLHARRIGQSKMKIARAIRTHLALMFTGKSSKSRSSSLAPSNAGAFVAPASEEEGAN